MLTLQMIRIMNKIWIQEGLDMRMVLFRCCSTGRGRGLYFFFLLHNLFVRLESLSDGSPCWPGMVEMIPQAETLRKIQVEHGVTGSFKDRPLADWLQKHNPSEEQYDKVHTPLLTFPSLRFPVSISQSINPP